MEIRIGVDVDGVINDFCKLFIERFNKKTGKNLRKEELTKWNLKELIDELYNKEINGEIANEILMEDNFMGSLELKEEVIEAFELIKNYKNIKIIIVTAVYKEAIPIREAWLKENLRDFNFQVFYETQKDKVKMDYLIDDAIHNLDMLSKKIGKDNCLCISETYNTDSSYRRFNSLKDAFEFILKKENLLISV